jgi:hypothetical protein
VDVQGISISTSSKMGVQGVSPSTEQWMCLVYPFITASSMDVQGVPPFITNSVDVQGVSQSLT